MSNPPRFSSIEDYCSKQEPPKGETLRKIVDLILAEFPELEPKIAWNVPTIHRGGKYVVGVDAFKKHLTFSAFSGKVIADFRERLEADYVVFKNCFQVPVDWEIDRELVFDLVRARLAELDK